MAGSTTAKGWKLYENFYEHEDHEEISTSTARSRPAKSGQAMRLNATFERSWLAAKSWKLNGFSSSNSAKARSSSQR